MKRPTKSELLHCPRCWRWTEHIHRVGAGTESYECCTCGHVQVYERPRETEPEREAQAA